jgi:hypothetical protein
VRSLTLWEGCAQLIFSCMSTGLQRGRVHGGRVPSSSENMHAARHTRTVTASPLRCAACVRALDIGHPGAACCYTTCVHISTYMCYLFDIRYACSRPCLPLSDPSTHTHTHTEREREREREREVSTHLRYTSWSRPGRPILASSTQNSRMPFSRLFSAGSISPCVYAVLL